MSEKPNTPEIPKTEATASLSTETLLKMLIQTQKDLAASQKQVADAIIESRKPYVDPNVLKQKQQELEDRKKMVEYDLAIRVAKKQQCPHLRENGTSAINWMEHSNRIVKGVCNRCFSEFDSRDPKDVQLLRFDLKSQQNMGRAGQHTMTRAIGQA